MNRHRVLALALILSVLVSATGTAQTILSSDLSCFVGRLRLFDPNGDELFQHSQVETWFVEEDCNVDGERSRLQEQEFSSFHVTIANTHELDHQEGKLYWKGFLSGRRADWERYRWYLFSDYSGSDLQRNVLTVWEKTGDSLRFQCGQHGPFDTQNGWAIVRRVTIFPDSSLLVVVEKMNEAFDSYEFLRGFSPCDLESFYSYDMEKPSEDGKPFVRTRFKLQRLTYLRYRIERITGFCSYRTVPDFAGGTEIRQSVDSVTMDTVDIWQMAVKHFEIDTTGMGVR